MNLDDDFKNFWETLTPQRRAVLLTFYYNGLWHFQQSTIEQTVLSIDQISLMDSFDVANAEVAKCLEGVFADAKSLNPSSPDQFGKVCIILRNRVFHDAQGL